MGRIVSPGKRGRMQASGLHDKTTPIVEGGEKTTSKAEVAPGIAGLIVAAVVALVIMMSHSNIRQFGTQSDSLGPWFLPWLSFAGIVLGSVPLLLRRRSTQEADRLGEEYGSMREAGIWIGLASLAVYVWVMPYLGFYVDTAFLLGEFAFIFRLRLRTVVVVGISMELLAYLLFVRLLHILLPAWPI